MHAVDAACVSLVVCAASGAAEAATEVLLRRTPHGWAGEWRRCHAADWTPLDPPAAADLARYARLTLAPPAASAAARPTIPPEAPDLGAAD